jgi:AGZA family xanthine/uracil permease-like MFS transporter
MTFLERRFRVREHGSTVRREIVGGVTTFLTMAYIVVVNPKILEAAGIPFGASMVATILTAAFGTLVMGLYARRPFAVAPYMGENAFVAFTVVGLLGHPWQTALGAVFLSGVLFTLLTLVRLRSWLANAIPEPLKRSFAVGIGLFLAFIGLHTSGIVVLGSPGAPVHVGDFGDARVLLAVFGFVAIAGLMIRRVPGAILIGILATLALGFALRAAPAPSGVVSLPPSLAPTLLALDVRGALTWAFFPVVLTLFVMAFVDTIGTLMGLAYRANLVDERGELPDIEKPMLADSLATVGGSLLGTTTAGAYIESATGIEAGARTGLAAIVVAVLFLLSLFFAPLLSAIPPYAYGPALIVVGMLMLAPAARLPFDDLTELVPAFATIALMSFTYNLGIGMTAGFVIYPVTKLVAGRAREVPLGMWILAAMSAVFYAFYPY